MASTRSLSWPVGLLIVQLASVVALGWATPLGSGFPLDDSWIHQTAARNLVEHGTLGLVPGRVGSGTTSILWVAMLAINYAVLHLPPSTYTALLGVSLLVVAGQVVFHCARLDGWNNSRAWIFAALFSVSPNYVWFSLSGMEVCLGTALLVLSIWLWFSRPESKTRAAASGSILALAALTRPESVVLCFGILALVRRARRPHSHLVWGATPLVAVSIVYAAANLMANGQVLPTTLAGRRWLWLQEATMWPWYELRIQLVAHWLDRLWQFSLCEPWLPLYWVLIGLALVGAARVGFQTSRISALATMTVLQFGTYALFLPVEGHGGRYQPLVAALFLPLCCEGATMWLLFVTACRPALKRVGQLVPWLFPAALSPTLVACYAKWSEAHSTSIQHINATEVAAGRWAATLPRTARIASFDIGAISYYRGGRLLDLGALSDPSLLVTIQQGKLGAVLAAKRIEYLIVPMGYSDDFPEPLSLLWRLGLLGKQGPRMRQVREFVSSPAVWIPGFQATMHSAPRQVVLQISPEWEGNS